MAKRKTSKKAAQVSKRQLRETAEALGTVGAVEAIAGANDMMAGAAELSAARDLNRASKAAAAQGAANVTRGADQMRAGAVVSAAGEYATAAGARDVAEGEAMLASAGEAAIIAHMIKGLSHDDISQGMELAGMAGQMRAVRDVVEMLGMQQLSAFMSTMTTKMHAVAVYNLVRSQETRLLAGKARGVAGDMADLGENEQAEGIARMALGQDAMFAGDLLSEAGAENAVQGMEQLEDSAILGDAAREYAGAGIASVAEGSRELGSAETTEEVAEAFAAAGE